MTLPANPLRKALGETPLALHLDAKKNLDRDKRNRRGREERSRERRRGGGSLGAKPRQPVAIIAETERRLREVALRSHAAIVERLLPRLPDEVLEREQAWKLARSIAKESGVSLAVAKQLAGATFEQTERFNFRDIARSIGLKVPEFTSAVGDRWRKEHAERIVGLSEVSRDRIVEHLRDVGERGTRVETLMKRLEETEGMSARRARLVARDSVLTLNADLTRDRHKRAGITQYRWLAISDGSSRQHHLDLDGQVFDYDDPPLGGGTGPDDFGHPGEGIGCRCQAIPVVPEAEG